MRIIHADTDDLGNPLRGGQPVRTFEVNTRLSAHHDITVLTSTYPGCVRRLRRGRVDYRRLGVTVPGFGLSPHLSYLASLGVAVRRTPHDLLVEEFSPPIGFGLLPWWTRKPVVCIVQWFSLEAWEKRYRLPFEKIMRSICRPAGYNNFIVQSSKMAGYFEAINPSARIWTLGCGVDDDAFMPSGKDGLYALFLGRLDVMHKGLDRLIEAWVELRGEGAAIPLKVVGEGPGRAYLECEIKTAGLGGCVTLLGRLEGAQKRDVLRGAAFVVMPSRMETFGIVALEAMAASKPVIAFNIDNLNEVLRPAWSVQVEGTEKLALAHAILQLWHDPARRRTLGEKAFQAAQSMRWDEVARQQDAIYSEVVGGADNR